MMDDLELQSSEPRDYSDGLVIVTDSGPTFTRMEKAAGRLLRRLGLRPFIDYELKDRILRRLPQLLTILGGSRPIVSQSVAERRRMFSSATQSLDRFRCGSAMKLAARHGFAMQDAVLLCRTLNQGVRFDETLVPRLAALLNIPSGEARLALCLCARDCFSLKPEDWPPEFENMANLTRDFVPTWGVEDSDDGGFIVTDYYDKRGRPCSSGECVEPTINGYSATGVKRWSRGPQFDGDVF